MNKEWLMTRAEQKEREKRWKANGIDTEWIGEDLIVKFPDVTIIYKLRPEVEEPEQLSFLEGLIL